MLDILSIGDCTLDVFLTIQEGDVKCSINKNYCEICFHYGDKIPVDEVIQIPGTGNAANLAIGARRLGLNSAISTIIGDKTVGKAIINNFKTNKVNLEYLIQDLKSPTNYSTVINYKGERTIFSHHEERKYKFPKLTTPPKWIYLTSVGHGYENLYKKVVAYCKKHNVKLGFNPGSLQVRDGFKKIKNVINQSDVILINKEEAATILNIKNNGNIKELLEKVYNLGPELVVITDGENGAYSYDGEEFIHIPATKTNVIERTGAGDAFSTGYISAIVHGNNHREALIWGTMNSDEVIKFVGPQEGLLTKTKMDKKVKYCPVKVKKI